MPDTEGSSQQASRLLTVSTEQDKNGSDATMLTPPVMSAADTTISILSQTGSRTNLTLSPYKTVLDIKSTLVTAWPSDFGDHPVRPAQLRLIHAGKILDDTQLIETLKTPEGIIVIHASVRPPSLETGKVAKDSKSTNCCTIS